MIKYVTAGKVVMPQQALSGVLAVLLLVSVAGAARAAINSTINASDLDPHFYITQSYAEIKDPSDNLLDGGGYIDWENTNPPTANVSGTLHASGSSLAYTAFADLDAFGHARVSATANVTNTVANYGYNVVASRGSRTQAYFDSSATPGKVVFNFTISGTESTPYGLALGRLDFLARTLTPASSYFDVFGSEALHAVGAGNYSFTYLGSTTQPLDILFYVAAAVVTQNEGVPGSTNFTAFADFANTFNLTSIDLFDTNDDPIEEWTLVDAVGDTPVFNQDGRIAVPEPASALLLAVSGGLMLVRRRSV